MYHQAHQLQPEWFLGGGKEVGLQTRQGLSGWFLAILWYLLLSSSWQPRGLSVHKFSIDPRLSQLRRGFSDKCQHLNSFHRLGYLLRPALHLRVDSSRLSLWSLKLIDRHPHLYFQRLLRYRQRASCLKHCLIMETLASSASYLCLAMVGLKQAL